MYKNHQLSERGQSMVLVALMVVAFAAMLALVLDGGTAYAGRRKAQNAADAGALAGAQYMCARLGTSGIATSAGNVALDYAITKNGATSAVAAVNVATKIITVTASIRQDSFFAGMIGRQVYTPTAVAAAKCSPTGGSGVLPIAWSCRPPVEGMADDFDCAEYANDPNYMYLIMDSADYSADFCQNPPNSGLPIGALDCDLDNNGVDEILGSGGRSWVDLDGDGSAGDGGSQGASELSNWIQSGFNGTLPKHIWLGDQTGVAGSIFGSAETYLEGKDILIPVFDRYCDGDPRTTPTCIWDPEDQIKSLSSGRFYFHIMGFAIFHIVCVSDVPSKHCTVKDLAVSQGIIDHNKKTMEGYFKRGHYASHGTGGDDALWTGAFVVRLIR